MAGIYIHIPFCKKACHYCNFHFSTSLQLQDEMLDAIVQEIVIQKGYLTQPIDTIYIGGGTPSFVRVQFIEKILDELKKHFIMNSNIECTLEANPDDITKPKMEAWKAIGINRLSIGIQSFVEADLQWMNRAHNVQQALNAIMLAKENGISNISIDLIYGTPNLSNADWKKNIETAINMGVQHLSCYALTVEPNTALQKMIALHKKEQVDPNKAAEQFEILMKIAPKMGLEHYEISNFATQGYRSRHNTSYWQGKHYLGIGPSAHSYNGVERQWNIANNALYIKNVQQNNLAFEIETLTKQNKINEYIMTSLRTIEGLNITHLDKNVNILNNASKFIQQGLMLLDNGF